jgi:L-aminopeptidase/D-esterase-like protein
MIKISMDELSGFQIGQAQDLTAMTGCTVVICKNGAVCGVDVRGGSPGTRDTDALHPVNNRSSVHAVLLSGGSSFGMDAAGGVMRFLEERKIGRDVGVTWYLTSALRFYLI